ncbi:sugar ABC transporter ATP-binding protein [Sinorhizobium chiapasense]|uniref:sugar ABC transporter ATP-binding protein n=1 Tax=Sinorhizobium chiapasense TaxID=501572 RepID=UPI0038CD7503
MTPLLRLVDVSKSFGATRALRGVSIDIFPGEIHCIIGENGAGKSTLGRICGGFVRPDTGSFWYGGKEVPFFSPEEARAAGLAMVFQELSLAPDLSIQDNLFLGADPTRNPLRVLRRSRERSECQSVLEAVGLGRIEIKRPVGQLPPGQQQLVEVSKALARNPRILVLDEPSAMLSLAERKHLHGIMGELRANGTAIVFVTHHVAEVAELADRVTVLRNGALVESIAGRQTVDQIVERLGGGGIPAPHRPQRHVVQNPESGTADFLSIVVPRLDGSTEAIRVAPGEVVGLYGVIGCGSERIASIVSGQASDAASVAMKVEGQSIAVNTPVRARRLGIGHLPNGRAANGILPRRSISENLYLRPRSRKQRASLAPTGGDTDKELSEIGVRYGNAKDPITSLSGGNQQKVLIGRLLGSDLRLLVLEEPTAGIDIAAKADVHNLLRKCTGKGWGILLVSSDLEEAIALSDRIHTMFDGQCVRTYSAPTTGDMSSISADVVGATQAKDREEIL